MLVLGWWWWRHQNETFLMVCKQILLVLFLKVKREREKEREKDKIWAIIRILRRYILSFDFCSMSSEDYLVIMIIPFSTLYIQQLIIINIRFVVYCVSWLGGLVIIFVHHSLREFFDRHLSLFFNSSFFCVLITC